MVEAGQSTRVDFRISSKPVSHVPGVEITARREVINKKSSETKHQISGLPGLMQVPVLGTLFKSRDYVNRQTELMVIVTPYIARAVARRQAHPQQRPDHREKREPVEQEVDRAVERRPSGIARVDGAAVPGLGLALHVATEWVDLRARPIPLR